MKYKFHRLYNVIGIISCDGRAFTNLNNHLLPSASNCFIFRTHKKVLPAGYLM